MLTEDMRNIVDNAREAGWILEPDAKRLLSLAGIRLSFQNFLNFVAGNFISFNCASESAKVLFNFCAQIYNFLQ